MPAYQFEMNGDDYRPETNLKDDAAAWSELVIWCGETIREADGRLGLNAEFTLRVRDGQRIVGEISIRAKGPSVVNGRPSSYIGN